MFDVGILVLYRYGFLEGYVFDAGLLVLYWYGLSTCTNVSFVAINTCSLRQNFCRDKHTFVTTNMCLS